MIAAERQRQIEEEGWSRDHDDEHRSGELAVAAARYAVEATDAVVHHPDDAALDWIKPETPIRNLVKAGALILAEIERLQRASVRAKLPARTCPDCGEDIPEGWFHGCD